MKNFRRNKNRRRRGFLAFEWMLLLTVLVIGIVGGLATVRNAIIAEMDDLATAILSLHDPAPDSDTDD